MNRTRIQRLAALVLAVIPLAAAAQSFPSRPVTMVMPLPSAGTNADRDSRALASEVSKVLGQQAIFDTRPGANMRLGLSAMKNAKPDGYVVSFGLDALLVAQPFADPTFQVEPDRDYVPVALTLQYPLLFTAQPGVPFRDVKGLVSYAKANPGKVTFAAGNGGTTHFFALRLRQAAGVDILIVPYKSAGIAIPDLLAGRVDLTAMSTTGKPLMEAGKLIGIATTGRERWSAFPNLPTLEESGVHMDTELWFGIIAPVGTPRDIVLKWNSALNQALASETMKKLYADDAFHVSANNTPENFGEFIRSEQKVWGPIIREAGIKIE